MVVLHVIEYVSIRDILLLNNISARYNEFCNSILFDWVIETIIDFKIIIVHKLLLTYNNNYYSLLLS